MGRLYCEGVAPEGLMDAAISWLARRGLSVEAVPGEKGTWVLRGKEGPPAAVFERCSRGVSIDIDEVGGRGSKSSFADDELLKKLKRELEEFARITLAIVDKCPECSTTFHGSLKYCPHCGLRLVPYVW